MTGVGLVVLALAGGDGRELSPWGESGGGGGGGTAEVLDGELKTSLMRAVSLVIW